MCGIAGVVAEGSDPALPELAARMAGALNHRGPDGQGAFASSDGLCAFGHRRLAVIDLLGGAQPMSDGRRTIVFNGEIYGFRALRDELSSRYSFRTRSDVEVILAAHQVFGDSAPERLPGMFAYAIWQHETRELLLVRDRFGKKPLFWTLHDSRLLFASELKGLLRVLHGSQTDPVALLQHLAVGYAPGERTAYRGLSRLPPGHVLRFRPGGRPELRRYWAPPLPRDAEAPRTDTADGWVERVEPLLRQAVRDRLVADVPLGAFLSGGLDSSTVVALAVREAARPFHTFSVRAEGGDASDAEAALEVSGLLGTEHHEIVLKCPTPEEAVSLLRHQDEPLADSSIFPTAAVSALARERVTVALSGDGGDELFGGYGIYRVLERIHALSRVPLLERGARTAGGAGPVFLRILAAPPAERYLALSQHFAGAELELLARSFPPGSLAEALAELRAVFAPPPGVGCTAAAQWIDQARGYLPGDILPKLDLASMRRALEVRCPLLDHRLAETLAGLPASLRRRGARGKLLLRRLARTLLPAHIVERRKVGFSVPLASWLRTGLRPLVEEYLLPRDGGLLDPDVVRACVAPPRNTRQARLQYTLLSAAVWARR